MPVTPQKTLRADAQSNLDRLLAVAAATFQQEGADTSMRAIAKSAGVGVGTLYRRFPTRDRLVEATYRSEVARLCAAATELLESRPALESLRMWMDLFVAFMATKEGMGEALRVILVDDDMKMKTRYLLADAIGMLLSEGATEGTLRTDVDPYDVLLGIGGVTLIAGDPNQAAITSRLLDLWIDGLRRGNQKQN
ncbi:TetR/AcrR family transcriptional regulator [Subtercola endophyticus]|uniref:TetR/AcrR family transcriptional regulator n=1 Tax=Subtercola endophyticus TaxID=2895559 RepID=UPI001E599035|nr:TetR/AcrR family transcriptional regulator [Subtercola endophyticus]UFS58185.1 TetR/AcrR family transcriptional regulator [Subtercola endophyticus]